MILAVRRCVGAKNESSRIIFRGECVQGDVLSGRSSLGPGLFLRALGSALLVARCDSILNEPERAVPLCEEVNVRPVLAIPRQRQRASVEIPKQGFV